MNANVLVVGTGPMAREHIKVLQSMAIPFTVVGRSQRGVEVFEHETGIPAVPGGIDAYLESSGAHEFSHCIVATSVTELYRNVLSLLRAGARKILVEKPCVLDARELNTLLTESSTRTAEVYIAYNRRFFSSVLKAKEIIEEDGGLDMVKFDFTEWAHVIEKLEKQPLEKERWLLANSTHVIDLAFHFAGVPKSLSAYRSGALDWHPSAKIFSGAGVSQAGVLFSYGSDWGSAGRWWLELFTPLRKLRLCPMEKLFETRKGTVVEQEVLCDAELDADFKPGLYLQTEKFLSGDKNGLCELQELNEKFKYFCEIAGYPTNA
ncbi:Gfo/Idh/MocA family oxidoreductase [Metapseudomonas furukawaii]|uniref:Gfo/Idh/MocA family oxidoreductase n=1 Tax=Metapseudomonas furukawaii TaxID=1149133 RepID=UPI0040457227